MDIVARARNILTAPEAEWPVIAREPATPQTILVPYVVVLAAIPAVAGFLGALLWYGVPFAAALVAAILQYAFTLVGVGIIGFVVKALAPSFGGNATLEDGLKLSAYGGTASWLAGVFQILPAPLNVLSIIGLYSLYLLWLGITPLTRVAEDKKIVFVLAVIVVAILVNVLIGYLVAPVARAFM